MAYKAANSYSRPLKPCPCWTVRWPGAFGVIPWRFAGEGARATWVIPNSTKAKYEPYREAWHLLQHATNPRRGTIDSIQACAEEFWPPYEAVNEENAEVKKVRSWFDEPSMCEPNMARSGRLQ